MLAVALSAVLWGTLWIPLRHVRGADPAGALRVGLGLLLPLAALAPWLLARREGLVPALRREIRPGFWLALGVALYAEGLVRGQVARVILLFYLTPLWSTLLARIALGEPITPRRVLALGLGLAGALVVFGPGAGPWRPGDAFGLLAGVAWAVAALETRRGAASALPDRAFVHFLLVGPLFLLAAALPGSPGAPGIGPWGQGGWAWVAALAGVWMLPVVLLTFFGAARLDPGRYALLLMLEVVVGLASSAALAGEAVGVREGTGAALILAAVAVELAAAGRPGASTRCAR